MENRYKKEFPSYDGILPQLRGWVDNSWHNDICPSLHRIVADEFGSVFMRIWCEFVDPMMREVPDSFRFSLDVQPNEECGEPHLFLHGETMEDLRQAAVRWYLDNVGDSILEDDLTTAEILDRVGIMWGFHNEGAVFNAKLRGAEISTGGGCRAYAFGIGSENQVWITDWDGCGLPVNGAPKMVCIRDHQGAESACITVDNSVNLKPLLKFLKEAGAQI
jgi:hypothetical protein